ncbi:MAG TPA: 30S ribosomal protein S20 [Phycisphaerales bacterium]|nr:30S ribosomal protein S20 [Phycisphaerales bacterium]HMP37630.1 30S ribosomal protein S20 [Phycisphaerales bacterium]
MPNTASAKKRVRQSVKRRALNSWRKRLIKDQIKALLKALHDRDATVAESEFRKTAALLDKIASTGTIHRNTAARRKSRLAARVNALRATPAAA